MTVLKTMQKPKTVGVNVGIKNQEVRAETPNIESSKEFTKATPSVDAIARRNRRTKSPIDGRRNILTVKGLAPGMVGRWVDNTPERMEQLMERGYEPVRSAVQIGDISIDGGAPVGAIKTKRVGGGREQVLMQIPEEWYKADQAEKQKIVDSREQATKHEDKTSGFYGKVEAADVVVGKRPRRRVSEEE